VVPNTAWEKLTGEGNGTCESLKKHSSQNPPGEEIVEEDRSRSYQGQDWNGNKVRAFAFKKKGGVGVRRNARQTRTWGNGKKIQRTKNARVLESEVRGSQVYGDRWGGNGRGWENEGRGMKGTLT